MNPLSLPLCRMRDRYDVVVVGSGYGGSIAASRLARAGRRVCLLERGIETLPGDYPEDLGHAQLQSTIDDQRHGNRLAMFDFHLHGGMSALVGCGLGGTSLINASVAIKPEPEVFKQSHWPKALRDISALDPYYARVDTMLHPTKYPKKDCLPPKVRAHEASAKHLKTRSAGGRGCSFDTVPITVNFTVSGPNDAGVVQQPCTNCGNCVSGCNVGAKNTTLMNYLPDARNFGAEIFTRSAVDHVEKRKDGWRVHFADPGDNSVAMWVDAEVVVLAAGTLGSTEILFRSRKSHRDEPGLSLSPTLGKRFSGNGDVIASGRNCDRPIDGVGWPHATDRDRPPVGPCIVSVIKRPGADLADSWIIEDGAVPGLLGEWLPGALRLARRLGTRKPPSTITTDPPVPPKLDALNPAPHDGLLNLPGIAPRS